MAGSVWERLLLRENLLWAWRKARALYARADTLYDPLSVSTFELDLERQLDAIRDDFRSVTYRMAPLRLLPEPKKPERSPDGGDRHRMRQSFGVAVRDQVAWIAVINAIGPVLDQQMPLWSYGHRLHRSTWVPEDHAERVRIGPYRHSGAKLFRSFRQSWPLYRRHIVLTARHLGSDGIAEDELDEGERRAYRAEHTRALNVFTPGYFGDSKDGQAYFASIDLKHFYPSLSVNSVLHGFRQHSSDVEADKEFRSLLRGMMEFEVDTSGLTSSTLASVEPSTEAGRYSGIPTGLMVAGFLSNVAMLSLDREVEREAPSFRVGHFRFVDDHTMVAPSFDDLVGWMRRYSELLRKFLPRVRVNWSKVDPPELGRVVRRRDARTSESGLNVLASARKACLVDPKYPRPLLTRTLAQLSLLGGTTFDALDDQGQSVELEQLKTLLLSDLPETELRADTRKSFAAGRLAALVPRRRVSIDGWVAAARDLRRLEGAITVSPATTATRSEDNERAAHAIATRRKDCRNGESRYQRELISRHHAAFDLLLDAFRSCPHKPRLFKQLLIFCLNTGHHGLREVSVEVARISRRHAPLGEYLSAFMLQIVGDLSPKAARRLRDPDASPRERAASAEFLNDVSALPLSRVDWRGAPYLRRAARFARVSVATTAHMIGRERNDFVPPDRARAARLLASIGFASRTPLEAFLGATVNDTAAWLNWAEDRVADWLATDPSGLWRGVQGHLSVTRAQDCLALRRYPQALPTAMLRAVAERQESSDGRDAGWEYEAARQGTRARVQVVHLSVRKALATPPEHCDLFQWCERLAAIHARNPFDPRVSEWTALEVLRQIMSQLQGRAVMHASNVLVPLGWCRDRPPSPWDRSSSEWTWENWRLFAREFPVVLRAEEDSIEDYRFTETDAALSLDKARAELSSYGLILLGLVRRSFRWPAVWNLRGRERSLRNLALRTAHRLGISTLTLEILEALLLPRPWETVLRASEPAFAGALDATALNRLPADTALDVATLSTRDEVVEAVHRTQLTLERGQLSALGHRPRQMVPVSITRLADSRLIGDGDDHEEDD